MDRVDHVIIGSGINALVAAAMLSGKGARVLLLEREAEIGGCMRTAEITLPGFHHDVMAATFVLFLTSPAHAALGADLARHGLTFCPTPHPTAVLRPDAVRLWQVLAALRGISPGIPPEALPPTVAGWKRQSLATRTASFTSMGWGPEITWMSVGTPWASMVMRSSTVPWARVSRARAG